MGHKRHKFRGSFENQAPGLTGPGITEPDYPAHMPDMMNGKPVIISLDHPENNPPGVTIEEFTEEVPRDSFGINVGQQMEDLLKAHAAQQSNHTKPNKKEETKMEDQLKENVDIINPINDIKYQEEFSHAGFAGGRKSLDSFTVPDRQYPKDGVGIISEATVDSAKTAFAASTSMDPTIVNMRGMTLTSNPDELKPTQILSISSLIMPGVTQDDSKRQNLNITEPYTGNSVRA